MIAWFFEIDIVPAVLNISLWIMFVLKRTIDSLIWRNFTRKPEFRLLKLWRFYKTYRDLIAADTQSFSMFTEIPIFDQRKTCSGKIIRKHGRKRNYLKDVSLVNRSSFLDKTKSSLSCVSLVVYKAIVVAHFFSGSIDHLNLIV